LRRFGGLYAITLSAHSTASKINGEMIVSMVSGGRYCIVDSANGDRRRGGRHCVLRYFAAGYPEADKLSEVLLKLNETSLSQLRRDHETGYLEHKIANPSK
jgi:hypothetical protein